MIVLTSVRVTKGRQAMLGVYIALAIIVLIVLVFGVGGLRVVNQYERGVIFVLGRLIGPRGPGVFYIPPIISRMVKVDLRIVTIEVPPQEIITRDNVTVSVSAVIYFYVVHPNDAVNQAVDYLRSTVQIAQTTLRNVLGQSELDELLAERETINRRLQAIIDEHTGRWGVKVTAVEIKDVGLPPTMQRAMAKQAEAEREKRAKVLHAQGEFLASQTLADAAAIISTEPAALQLRYLQTLAEIATEKTSTVIFPLPIDLVEPLGEILRHTASRMAPQPAPAESEASRPAVPIAPPASPWPQQRQE